MFKSGMIFILCNENMYVLILMEVLLWVLKLKSWWFLMLSLRI